MPQSHDVTSATNGGIRRDARTILAEPVEFGTLDGRWSAESTLTHNISSRGARVTTQRVWEPGSFVLLKSSRSNFSARARVVYWRSFSSSRFCIGVEFIEHSGSWRSRN